VSLVPISDQRSTASEADLYLDIEWQKYQHLQAENTPGLIARGSTLSSPTEHVHDKIHDSSTHARVNNIQAVNTSIGDFVKCNLKNLLYTRSRD
tara:strand:- start:151 stop:432 length:282 start_codon:yes stop_codon:yes gene_type:complete